MPVPAVKDLSRDAQIVAVSYFGLVPETTLRFGRPENIHPRMRSALDELTAAGILAREDDPRGPKQWALAPHMADLMRSAVREIPPASKDESFPMSRSGVDPEKRRSIRNDMDALMRLLRREFVENGAETVEAAALLDNGFSLLSTVEWLWANTKENRDIVGLAAYDLVETANCTFANGYPDIAAEQRTEGHGSLRDVVAEYVPLEVQPAKRGRSPRGR